MTLSVPRIRHYLQTFALEKMFIEELGWDHHSARITVQVDGQTYSLTAFAEKHGVQIFECRADAEGNHPDYATRRKIEKQVTKSAYEHLIIFINADKTEQIWQWVSRQPGHPAAYREHHYNPPHHSGDSLIQKLESITFTLSEEEGLTLTGVVFRLHDAFDRDRVTKKFYDHFKKEHRNFFDFIQGITEQGDREWYASLMLNRLMFVYFIQRKGFLDGDVEYLKNRLKMVQERKGRDKFLTFYRYFLVRLFHEGFAQQPAQRTPDLDGLLGKVPYLDGGLFELHELEEKHPDIGVSDKAFERLFGFFDQYEWHLDTRPLSNDREINPDVLGYIFEKYINQKQMGAYYTKEDITGYISKNTIIPYLFDAAKKKCAIAFHPDSALWRLLRDDPDRYIYPAVRKGVVDENGEVIPLPEEIEKGIKNVNQRGEWNRPADPDYALPTEIWREHVARRQRYLELREKLKAEEIHQINDLITYNLDIRQFVEDVITGSEGPELLRAFYKAISTITVLDSTCGSGAFLFAALNMLEPLYEACLDRMQGFVDDLDRSGERHRPEKFSDFRNTLADIDRHPNRRYFILKSIIVNNLYGVDIMQEAVEICKLRLFLKLVAQVDKTQQLEPLPDIDFNIRAGNTLVGFTDLEDVKNTLEGKLPFYKDQVGFIVEEAEFVERAFQRFHEMQIEQQMDAIEFSEAKKELRLRLVNLNAELDQYLAAKYGIDSAKETAYQKWKQSHQPFHWFAEYYGIMSSGGFNVIIGNPPYVEYSKVRKAYQIQDLVAVGCGNLYAFCIERSYEILTSMGRFGFIVQGPIVSTKRMRSIRNVLREGSDHLFFSTYDDRPSKLFDGMHHCRLAIIVARRKVYRSKIVISTSKYHKWYKEERSHLFQTLNYLPLPEAFDEDIIPKFRSVRELSIYRKVHEMKKSLGHIMSLTPTEYKIYYKITGVGHWFTFTLKPPKFWRDGEEGSSTRESTANFDSLILRDTAYCCLCSTLHYWLYQMRTNCRDFNPFDLKYLPVPESMVKGPPDFNLIAERIMSRIEETSHISSGSYAIGGSVRYQKFKPRSAKDLFDEVDRRLAQYYGFTLEELDFILNYDIKYRLGRDSNEE